MELQGPAPAVLRSMTLPAVDPDTRYENILSGTLAREDAPGETAQLLVGETRLVVPRTGAFPSGGSAVFAVSPDDILVSTRAPDHISARNVLRGTLIAKQDSDTGDWIRVAAGGIEWTVRLTESAAVELHLAPGSEVWLAVKTHTIQRLR